MSPPLVPQNPQWVGRRRSGARWRSRHAADCRPRIRGAPPVDVCEAAGPFAGAIPARAPAAALPAPAGAIPARAPAAALPAPVAAIPARAPAAALPAPVAAALLVGVVTAVSAFVPPPAAAAAPQDIASVDDEAAFDPWVPEPSRSDRKALERLEKERRELDIVGEPAGTIDPCSRPDGPNLVNFVRRGEHPGDPTYLFGIDLCSRRPFVYREPTRSGVIVGIDANPPRIEWAEDPEDDRNLRGDRFAAELVVGVDMLFGTSTVDYGESANGSVDFAAAPSLGVRIDRVRATFSRAVAPPERTWLAKVAVTPFRQGPPERPAPVPLPAGPAENRITWYEPVAEPCNAPGVGMRGFDRFRMGGRTTDRRYPVTLEMVSYCTRPYRVYRVATYTDRTYFRQLNNTFPKFAAWDEIPRGGLINNLSFSVGFGEVLNDVFNVDFPTNVIYVGLGVAFGDSRWRVDAGRLFSNEKLDLVSAGVPVTVSTSGWTVQVQRAVHFEELFGR